jgi:hypothetical protein
MCKITRYKPILFGAIKYTSMLEFRDVLLNGLMMMYVANTHLDLSWIFID